MVPQGPAPRYSEDGHWWWDGSQWLSTSTFAPATTEPGLQVQNAGFWLRTAAYVIDWLILTAATVLLSIAFNTAGYLLDSAANTRSVFSAVFSLLNTLIWMAGNWLYFSLQESSLKQGTIGKRALGIRVIDYQGRRLTFGRATARYWAKLLSAMICFIGFVMAGFTERKQALHDIIANTLVVRTRPDPTRQFQPVASSGAGAIILTIVAAIGILLFTSIVVIVILLTMGGQIKNVFSNVVVALNGP